MYPKISVYRLVHSLLAYTRASHPFHRLHGHRIPHSSDRHSLGVHHHPLLRRTVRHRHVPSRRHVHCLHGHHRPHRSHRRQTARRASSPHRARRSRRSRVVRGAHRAHRVRGADGARGDRLGGGLGGRRSVLGARRGMDGAATSQRLPSDLHGVFRAAGELLHQREREEETSAMEDQRLPHCCCSERMRLSSFAVQLLR